MKSQLSAEFIDSLLSWANGISGKIDHLLIPLTRGESHHRIIKNLKGVAASINKKRNSVAHQGEFCNPVESEDVIQKAKEFIETLMNIYEPEFVLTVLKSSGI